MSAITREEIERIVLDADNRTPLFPIQPKRYSMGISIGERVAALVEERIRKRLLDNLARVHYDNGYLVEAVPKVAILNLFAQFEADRKGRDERSIRSVNKN